MKLYMMYYKRYVIENIKIAEIDADWDEKRKQYILKDIPIDIYPKLDENDLGKSNKADDGKGETYEYMIDNKRISVEISAHNLRASMVNELRTKLEKWETVRIIYEKDRI